MAQIDEFEDEETRNYLKDLWWTWVTTVISGMVLLAIIYLGSSPDTYIRNMSPTMWVIAFLSLTIISQLIAGRKITKERNGAVAKLRTLDRDRGLEVFANATAVKAPSVSSVTSETPNLAKIKAEGGLLIQTHDHILNGNDLRPSTEILTSTVEGKLKDLSIVVYTFRNLSRKTIDHCVFRIVKNREGQVLSATSSRAGYPKYKSGVNIDAEGVTVTIDDMRTLEFFKVEILSDGLREADFRFEADSTEPDDLNIRIEPQDYWIPNPTIQPPLHSSTASRQPQ